MSASPSDEDKQQTPPTNSSVILLLSTIGDTTWRMFGPTILLTIVGIYGDNMLDTTPWLTVAGVLLGAVGAGLLVRNQLIKVNK